MNKNTDRYLEDYVNTLAVEYYQARKNKNKLSELKASTELMRCITKNTDSSPYKKTISKINRYGLLQEKEDIVNEALFMSMTKYKPVLTDENGETKEYPFFPYYMKALVFCCNEKLRKNKDKACHESISLDYDPSENETGEHNTEVFAKLADEKADLEESCKSNERKQEILVRIPTVITKFFEHNGTGEYARKRLSYFRIFYTERLLVVISELGCTSGLNKSETYECSDQELVRFVSFSDYISLDDLICLKFKKRSEVLPDCNDDNPVLEIKSELSKIQDDVIVEYRYKAKFDQSRKKVQNISEQRKYFRKYLKKIFSN